MIVRQHFDPVSSTYTYLLIDSPSGEAVLIDPVLEQHARDAALIRELGVRLLYSLDTHCHADHVTGAWAMKRAFGCRIGLAEVYGASNVDLPLRPGMVVRFGAEALEVRATPGHTAGCLSFVSADHRCVFTGDALLIRGCGRTDFQNGDPGQLYDSIVSVLFELPDDTLVYPAHDYAGRTVSTIGEERRFNPRIANTPRDAFIARMNALRLPSPAHIAESVPANRECGAQAS